MAFLSSFSWSTFKVADTLEGRKVRGIIPRKWLAALVEKSNQGVEHSGYQPVPIRGVIKYGWLENGRNRWSSYWKPSFLVDFPIAISDYHFGSIPWNRKITIFLWFSHGFPMVFPWKMVISPPLAAPDLRPQDPLGRPRPQRLGPVPPSPLRCAPPWRCTSEVKWRWMVISNMDSYPRWSILWGKCR